ncbi:MAG: variant-type mycofactocin precursor [Desulfobacterales bacterium]|jgi:mycofactocin precursor
MQMKDKDVKETLEQKKEIDSTEKQAIAPPILEEITIEELAVDGICGIY